MATNYTFDFQNLNPTTTGWTGNSIQQTLADLRNTPFDPLDEEEMIDDTTAADPTGAGAEITNLKQGQNQLKSVKNLIKRLTRGSRQAPDLDSIKFYNEEILKAQKEQERVQTALDGLYGSDKALTQPQRTARLTKMVAGFDTKLDAGQDKLDAGRTSVESLQRAIAGTTDPKVLEHLQKQLATEQKKLSKDQSKFDAQTAHRTQLQNKLVALSPPVPGTPAPVPSTGTTTPVSGTTTPVAPPVVRPPNYYDQLIDKALATRSGASGWHSGTPPVAAPIPSPAVVPAPIPAVIPPTGVPGVPSTVSGIVAPIINPLTGLPSAPAPTIDPLTGLPIPLTVGQIRQRARQPAVSPFVGPLPASGWT